MLEITIQRREGKGWPVVAERHRAETLLPVRSEGRLELDEPINSSPRAYGITLGQALFRGAVRDALVQARNDQPGGVRVLLFVEAEELKTWRWEWLCAPVDGATWDFLSLDQRVFYSLYLPSLTDRAYPPIGRRDLRALVVVANPADPDKRYGLTSFDVGQNVTRLQSIFGVRSPATVLARAPVAVGLPTLDAIATQMTEGGPEGPYTILHLVCHGWVNPEAEGETTLYLERPSPDPSSGQVLAQPVQGTELIERLRRVSRLPYLVFLSVCESAAPEAEQRLGGLAQRLVRELGIPAVVGMTERVTVATAQALAEQFYTRLFAQTKAGEVDRALVEAYASLAARPDVNVPALYSRLGEQPLFSAAVDRLLTVVEIEAGLRQLDDLLVERAPVLRPRLAEIAGQLQSKLETSPEALSGTARRERGQALTRLNELCSETIEISFHALAQGEQPPAYDARQPFRGLSPFRAEDREFFFGRDSLVEKLQKKLGADNFLAVLGPSGSGKSSLVLAGLAPKLKAQIPGVQVIDDLTPGSAPLEQLKVRQSRLGPGPVLYIVDQFEELFTLCKDEGERTAFIDELLKLAQTNRVVLTMRADFWGECARYMTLKDRMLARQELVAPMTAGELRGAMEQQAAKVGLRFEADLSNRMLDEVAGEPGAMPLLQHALLELWKRRHGRWLRAEEYRAIGGVKQAIAETADRLYNEASAAEQERIRDIFLRLTQIDDSDARGEERRDTRRRLPLIEVLPAGSDLEETKALVKRLADHVLIVTSRNELTGQEELEVSHEALIRYWARLRTWLNDDLMSLRLRDSISEAAREWAKKPNDDSLLLHRGGRLEAINEALGHPRFVLTASENDYVNACRRLADTELKTRTRRLKQAWAIAVVMLGLAIFAGWKWWDANRQAANAQAQAKIAAERKEDALKAEAKAIQNFDRANSEAIRAEEQKRATRVNETQALAALSRVAFAENRPVEAVKLGLAAWPGQVGDDRPRLESSLASISLALSQSALMVRQFKHEGAVDGAIWSKDGSRILSWSRDDWSKDQSLRVWDVATGRQVGPAMRHDRGIHGALWSKDENRILSWSDDGTLRLWDPATGNQIGPAMRHDGWVYGAMWTNDEKRILSWSYDKSLRLWDAATSKQVGLSMSHEGSVTGARWSRDESHILSWSLDKTVRMWDAKTGQQIGPAMQHKHWPTAAWNNDESRILSWSWEILRLWDPATGMPVGPVMKHDSIIRGAIWSKDGTRVLSWSDDHSLRLWNVATGKQIDKPSLMKHDENVRGALWNRDESRILSWSYDKSLRLWDVATGQQIGPAMRHDDIVQGARWSNDERRILSWSADTVRLWDAVTGQQIGPAMRHNEMVRGAIWSRDERHVLSWSGRMREAWSGDNSLRLWDVSTGQQIGAAMHRDDEVQGALWSKEEGSILSWYNDGMRVWDTRTNKQLGPDIRHDSSVRGALWSKDERRVVSWSFDDTLRLWDVVTGNQIGASMEHDESVNGAIWSRDESRILSWSNDHTLRLWGTETGRQIGPAMRHDAKVTGALWSRDESQALSWSGDETGLGEGDKTVRLWDVATGRPIAMLRHEDTVRGARWNKDESRVLSWSADETLRLWDAATGQPIIPTMHHDSGVNGAIWSKDESRILSWSSDNSLRLWDVASGKQIGAAMLHVGSVRGAAWNNDGGRILSWSDDNTLRLWETASGKQIGPVMKHDGGVLGAVWSKDESRILSWSYDKTIRLWDVPTAQQIGPAKRHVGEVSRAIWSKDGGRVLSWSEGTLMLWDDNWPTGNLLKVACAILPDHDLSEVSRSYGLTLADPICKSLARPDWAFIERLSR